MPRKKRKGKNRRTRHHIIPRSRDGVGLEHNIAIVGNRHHQIYHLLFGNFTPDEIINWLVTYFWAGQWQHVERALKRKGG